MALDHQPSDAELLDRSRTDPEAFRVVYERHVRVLHGWLLSRVQDDQVAFDLTAETFAQALRSRRRFRAPEDGSAGPWLQGIAHNLWRSWSHDQRVASASRRRLGMTLPTIANETHDIDAEIDRIQAGIAATKLADALQDLPALQREAIELRVVGELPWAEVARRMDCSIETARKRVARGLRTLNARLEGTLA